MKNVLLFCACAVMCFQSACTSTRQQTGKTENKANNDCKQVNKSQKLIGVNSLLLRVPEKTVLKMGLLGNSKVEFSPVEAQKLLGSLKQQPGVEPVSFNTCVFVSGESGSFREVTEHNLPVDKKNKKTQDIDSGRRFTSHGTYNSTTNTISMTVNGQFVILPETY